MNPNDFIHNWASITELIESQEDVPNVLQNQPLDIGSASIILIGAIVILAILFTLVVTSE